MSFLTVIFGDANKKYLQELSEVVASISTHEAAYAAFSDSELKAKTTELKATVAAAYEAQSEGFAALEAQILMTVDETERNRLLKDRIQLQNQPLNEVLPEAFALVREASKRTLSMRHFDVQFMGGIVLHEGQVAEMKTGEGKTLVATLAVYLNALLGKGVHVVTVNDYLAKRDAVWMAQIYDFLGLSVGIIVHDSAYLYDASVTTKSEDMVRDEGVKIEMDFLRPVHRKEAYQADITYGTNNEFGFDYLRDNMVTNIEQKVQRELNFAIVDEVDSILIDEARTPLIISAPDTRPTDRYYQFAQLVETLTPTDDYLVDEKMRAATLTEQGLAKVEKALGVENIYIEEGIQTVHHIEQALRARSLYTRDKDYTVKDGEVIIVDEFTGRLLQGRRYSEGLHQAIEAKEGVAIQRESKTMATITFQNYFRLYTKLAGMTGTAETEAEELAKIYNLDVTTIPTNKPMVRKDLQDRIYKSEVGKFKAVVAEIQQRHSTGQPLLVGTISIEKNEYLGRLLEQEGLPFNMLNAKNHEREAEIIAQAGAPGAITIATNMAGRGVDIKLGGQPFDDSKYKEVVASGGLHVLGTERHESRRIDNQLRGRSGRQGDPGSSQFYVSLEDDLMRIFGAERTKVLMKSWPEDMPIENGIISKSLESAQKRVEGHNFDIRKHLVEYDDVANKQRTYVYNKRNQILSLAKNHDDALIAMAVTDVVEACSDVILGHNGHDDASYDSQEFLERLHAILGHQVVSAKDIHEVISKAGRPDQVGHDLEEFCKTKIEGHLEKLSEEAKKQFGGENNPSPIHEIMAVLYLRSIDMLWVDHLETLQYLRTGIGLRGYGQRDPVVEYKRESKDLFNALLFDVRHQFVASIMNISITPAVKTTTLREQQPATLHEHKTTVSSFAPQEEEAKQAIESKPRTQEGVKIGRNDPCYCGSGKKYKKCHGKE